jgi:hypothetical protein
LKLGAGRPSRHDARPSALARKADTCSTRVGACVGILLKEAEEERTDPIYKSNPPLLPTCCSFSAGSREQVAYTKRPPGFTSRAARDKTRAYVITTRKSNR